MQLWLTIRLNHILYIFLVQYKEWVHTGHRDLFGNREKESWELLPASIEEYYAAAGNSIIHEKMDEEGAIHYFTTSVDVEEELEKSRHVYPRV